MDMTPEHRASLGALIETQRTLLFGTRVKAYRAAEVNPATWTKAEEGGSIRPDLLAKIVRTLWPETKGDWRLVLEGAHSSLSGEGSLSAGGYVAAPGAPADEATATNAEVLKEIRSMKADVAALSDKIDRHTARLEALEDRER